MKYGTLRVICGPMFAGKTTKMISEIITERKENKKVLVIKPMFDVRYSLNNITSHDGLNIEAHSINSWNDLISQHAIEAEIIFLDEIQFFTTEYFYDNIVEIVMNLLSQGKNVTVNGLDTDWKGYAFTTTALFMSMADEVIKLSANCSICGSQATKTFKKKFDEDIVALGNDDLYEPRCNNHWNFRGLT